MHIKTTGKPLARLLKELAVEFTKGGPEGPLASGLMDEIEERIVKSPSASAFELYMRYIDQEPGTSQRLAVNQKFYDAVNQNFVLDPSDVSNAYILAILEYRRGNVTRARQILDRLSRSEYGISAMAQRKTEQFSRDADTLV